MDDGINYTTFYRRKFLTASNQLVEIILEDMNEAGYRFRVEKAHEILCNVKLAGLSEEETLSLVEDERTNMMPLEERQALLNMFKNTFKMNEVQACEALRIEITNRRAKKTMEQKYKK